MLTEMQAKEKWCLVQPKTKCGSEECMGWMPAQRNKPDEENSYGQCIHHLGMQALMNASAVLLAGGQQKESRVIT